MAGEGIEVVDEAAAVALKGDWRSKLLTEEDEDDEAAAAACCSWLVERVFCAVECSKERKELLIISNQIKINILYNQPPVVAVFVGIFIPGTFAVDSGTETYKLGAFAAVADADAVVVVVVTLPPFAAAIAAWAAAYLSSLSLAVIELVAAFAADEEDDDAVLCPLVVDVDPVVILLSLILDLWCDDDVVEEDWLPAFVFVAEAEDECAFDDVINDTASRLFCEFVSAVELINDWCVGGLNSVFC